MEDNKEIEFSESLKMNIENYGINNQDGVKESLRSCQDIFGYVSSYHQEKISNDFEVDIKIVKTLIKLSPSIKESIVDYEIVCCTGRRCASNGSVEVIKELKRLLKIDFNETSEDKKIRLTTQNCFKKCNLGPNIMVNGEFYHHMDKAKVNKLIETINKN